MREVLKAFGFHRDWIDWIIILTFGAYFSILVNGAPAQPFSPSRGIRQGGPLSPFLFILMVEGLGRTISIALDNNHLIGLKLHDFGTTSTHQKFMDDTLLMGVPTVVEASISIKS